ncbi:MAG: hypothetical protein QOC81_4622 [Thermoanaerobaculia bacterium]|jgi:uncharacterized protein YbjT (DUF2867 family)|nr:hypothetical protein [Thermoanaerobaculia bacterium]
MGTVKRILVTGATGTVGRQVVAQLLDGGAHVRGLTRNPDRAALPREAEVIGGDLTDPKTLDAAVCDVDSVFLVWTAAADAFPAALARIAQHTGRVVMLTSPHQTPHPFFQQPNPMASMHKNMERVVRESGLHWTLVRPGMFAANALGWWAPRIREHDVVRWPYADAATAPIDERDIAAVAVRALLDESTGGNDYMITGPQSLTQREQVITIGDVIGRALQFEEITPDDARRELGFPLAAIDMLLNAWSAAAGLPAYVTTTVAEVTGTPARTFAEWVKSNEHAFVRA